MCCRRVVTGGRRAQFLSGLCASTQSVGAEQDVLGWAGPEQPDTRQDSLVYGGATEEIRENATENIIDAGFISLHHCTWKGSRRKHPGCSLWFQVWVTVRQFLWRCHSQKLKRGGGLRGLKVRRCACITAFTYILASIERALVPTEKYAESRVMNKCSFGPQDTQR